MQQLTDTAATHAMTASSTVIFEVPHVVRSFRHKIAIFKSLLFVVALVVSLEKEVVVILFKTW
jgi:hypothetical protein